MLGDLLDAFDYVKSNNIGNGNAAAQDANRLRGKLEVAYRDLSAAQDQAKAAQDKAKVAQNETIGARSSLASFVARDAALTAALKEIAPKSSSAPGCWSRRGWSAGNEPASDWLQGF